MIFHSYSSQMNINLTIKDRRLDEESTLLRMACELRRLSTHSTLERQSAAGSLASAFDLHVK